MKQFVGLYFLFLALLFAAFYAPTSSVSILLNEGQRSLTIYFLDFFLAPEQRQGIDIWINPHYKIIITQACNGLIPIYILYAAILAYPSKLLHKVLWMLLSYVIFSLVNVLRILLVIFVTESGEGIDDFYWSHDLLGNMLLMFTGLALLIGFVKFSKRSRG
ncbi:MAG: hypothetical protein GQ531_06010 [Sulfurovum sp.]|nr:hypothetical protein [Sulfurovum sp.]